MVTRICDVHGCNNPVTSVVAGKVLCDEHAAPPAVPEHGTIGATERDRVSTAETLLTERALQLVAGVYPHAPEDTRRLTAALWLRRAAARLDKQKGAQP